MIPTFPAPYLPHHGLANPKPSSDGGLGTAGRADKPNFVSGELCQSVTLSARLGIMDGPICAVLLRRFPRKIADNVVQAVAVYMRAFVSFWLRAYKNFKHNNMDAFSPSDAVIVDKAHINIISARARQGAFDYLTSLATLPADNPFYAPKAANRILGSVRYRLPNLIGIVGISHSVSPHVCGQGRAVFPAPFRPADFSHFQEEMEVA